MKVRITRIFRCLPNIEHVHLEWARCHDTCIAFGVTLNGNLRRTLILTILSGGFKARVPATALNRQEWSSSPGLSASRIPPFPSHVEQPEFHISPPYSATCSDSSAPILCLTLFRIACSHQKRHLISCYWRPLTRLAFLFRGLVRATFIRSKRFQRRREQTHGRISSTSTSECSLQFNPPVLHHRSL